MAFDPFRRPRPLYVTCDAGLETVLTDELNALGALKVFPSHRGAGVFGGRETMWRINLECRTANRVLLPLAEFPATDKDTLYQGVSQIDWPQWFGVERTIAVDASAHKSTLNHTAFIGQVVKDAVCDRFRERLGKRPSVDKYHPDIRINARIDKDHCIISLCSSGERLHRRGYRVHTGSAPLKETLAAGILALSSWSPEKVTVDPMCGSGTLLIEAAMMAAHMPPGWLRARRNAFAFTRWSDHRSGDFIDYLEGLEEKIIPLKPGAFIGNDRDHEVVDMCEENFRRTGIDGSLLLSKSPIDQWSIPDTIAEGPRCAVTNPPYGERMGDDGRLSALYKELGRVLKNTVAGGESAVILGNDSPHQSLGLKPKTRYRLRNGAIPCTLYCAEIMPKRRS